MHLSRESDRIEKRFGRFEFRAFAVWTETRPGRKIRFAIRYRATIDCPIYCILTGIFSKENDGGERSNRHAQIPGRKSFECNPITTPAQSEIMLILVRYGIDWRRRRGRFSIILSKGNVVKREETRARCGWVTITRRERWRNKQGCDVSMIREGRGKKRTIEAKNKKRWR